jgi:hypothetical protein
VRVAAAWNSDRPAGVLVGVDETNVADLVALQIVWVAAHHGLRVQHERPDRKFLWSAVFSISSALGNPSAPRGPS